MERNFKIILTFPEIYDTITAIRRKEVQSVYTPEELIAYRCPRWDDYPDIGLYMDQVVAILEKALTVFNMDDSNTAVTSSMLNNYIKLKVVPPPEKKRYNQEQMAYFFSVCILKRFISLPEITSGMKAVLEKFEPKLLYNLFCDALEYSISSVFLPYLQMPPPEEFRKDVNPELAPVVLSITSAFANILLARYLIFNGTVIPSLPEG